MFPGKSFQTYTISNILIALSFIATAIVINSPDLIIFGKNSIFLDLGLYHIFIMQIFTGTFIHGGVMHLLFNSLFIYYFGNIVEEVIGKKIYLLFFIITVTVGTFGVILFSDVNTVGISGFAMALLGFYIIHSYISGNDDYKGGITALIINVGIGLSPGISFIGHFSGAIVGLIFGFVYVKMLKRI